MSLTKIGSIGINTGIKFSGLTTITTLNTSIDTLSIGGPVSIAGTLTYEDVTNVDAVGLITARNGIVVGSGITLSKDGDGFFTGVTTATTFVGALTGNVTGNISGGTIAGSTGTFTGDVDIADKIIHTGDTNTAIRFPAADTITAETAGSERIRIKSDGSLQVPIGSDIEIGQIASSNHADGNAGSVLLGIQDGGGAMSGVKVTNVDAGTYNDQIVTFLTAQGGVSTPTERLRITSTGKVGINQSTPTAMLEVVDSAYNQLYVKGSSTVGGIRFGNSGNTTGFIYYDNGPNMLFNVDNAERMRIDSSGRLLIGTTSHTGHAVSSSNNPKMQLESASNADYGRASFIYNGNDSVGAGLWFAKSRGTSIGSNTVVADNDQVGGFFFHAADGTDKNSRCASIVVNVDGAPGANDTPGRISFSTTPDGSAASEEKVRIPGSTWGLLVTELSSTGSTGGYQTRGVSLRYSGDSTFVADGAAAVTMTRKTNAGKVLDFYSATSYAGGVYVNGANSAQYQSSSDYRLKDDITSMTDGINKVKQLNPIYYKSKMGFDTTTTQTGFLAHEVQSVIPTLVDGEKDADIDERGKGYQTLNYAGLAPTAIAAIKELIAKVETLETKVAALEG